MRAPLKTAVASWAPSLNITIIIIIIIIIGLTIGYYIGLSWIRNLQEIRDLMQLTVVKLFFSIIGLTNGGHVALFKQQYIFHKFG